MHLVVHNNNSFECVQYNGFDRYDSKFNHHKTKHKKKTKKKNNPTAIASHEELVRKKLSIIRKR